MLRIRELDRFESTLPPGRENAITDVAGVAVGHHTIIEGEEAIYNSLLMAHTVTGRDGNTRHGLPADEVATLLTRFQQPPVQRSNLS